MMLADLGADGDPRRSRLGAARRSREAVDTLLRNRRSIALNLKSPAGVAGAAAADRRRRRADRGFSSRRGGTAGPGPGRLPRAQSAAGLRPHDGLGPGGAARAGGGARHQLPGAHRRAAPDRRARPQAGAAAEPGRRLRRRRHDAALGAAGGAAGSRALGQGPGGRCRDDRRRHRAAEHRVFAARGTTGFRDETGGQLLAGGAPYYGTFETSDGKYLAIGLDRAAVLRAADREARLDRKYLAAGYPASRKHWPEAARRDRGGGRTTTRDEWAAIFDGTDACVAPVLSLAEARSIRTTWRAAASSRQRRGAACAGAAVQPYAAAPVRGAAPRGRRQRRRAADAGFSAAEIERLRAPAGCPDRAPPCPPKLMTFRTSPL